jgi:hypothetical protein
MASADTANKDLPTRTQITEFVNSIESPTVKTLSETAKINYPAWKWDTWKDKDGNDYLSFYFVSDSYKGFDSVYYDNTGKVLGKTCGLQMTNVDSYKGENQAPIKEETETVKEETTPIKEETETVKEETTPVKEETETAKEETNTEKLNNRISEDRHRIIQKIATLLTKYSNEKIGIDELRDGINEVLSVKLTSVLIFR